LPAEEFYLQSIPPKQIGGDGRLGRPTLIFFPMVRVIQLVMESAVATTKGYLELQCKTPFRVFVLVIKSLRSAVISNL